jgi:predicted Zn-dependent protease
VLIGARLYDEAIEWATYAFDHDPYALDWYVEPFLSAYSHKKSWSEAIATAESKVRENPKGNRVWYGVLGRVYSRTGQHEKATQALKTFTSLPAPPQE